MEEIISVIRGKLRKGCPVDIKEYSIDSRSVITPERTLFFALKGKNHDGHNYISDLYEEGVRAFVISDWLPEFDRLKEANFITVINVLKALQTLAAYHRQQVSAEIVGITGSNGKTITKEWLYQLLADDYAVYRSPRSYNSQVGVPLSLLGIDDKAEIAIIEAGISRPGEMARLQKMIQPTIGIFTHAGKAHDENFVSTQAKITEKAQLFQSCRYIIGQEGDALDLIKQQNPNAHILSWGYSPLNEMLVKTIKITQQERRLEIRYHEQEFPLCIPSADEASLENSMNAVAYLLLKGISPEIITQRVARLSAIAMRLEIKEGVNNCLLVNDFYNSDPDSFQVALNMLTMQDISRKRTVILSDFVDTGKANSKLYPRIAEMLKQADVDLFIGIGEKLRDYRHYFPANSRFYRDTEQFLRQEERGRFLNQVILIKGARAFQLEYIAGFLQKKSHNTILEVDLDAIIHNLNHFRSLTNAHLAVMVKAFSYGSGSKEIASLLQYVGVDYLMVAFADEGIELRAAGISTPIAVMNPEREAFDNMITFNLEPEIYSLDILQDFNKALDKHGIKQFPVHIKLNTGMNRSGFDEQDIPALLDFFRSGERSVYIRSMFSHLAGSDEAVHDEFTLEQIHLFERMTARIQANFDYKIWRHILNSAGIERFPRYHFDMVRLGIGLHGISAANARLRPVSTFKTHIMSVRDVPAGVSIGYGRKSYTERPSRIAVIPVGYADGLNRHLSNRVGEVYVRGQRVPIIGNICMDTCMIDITGTNAQIGDEVEIFGKHILVTEVADKLGTIPYEVLTGVSQRVKRIYYKE